MPMSQQDLPLVINAKPGQSLEQAIAETALQPSMLGSAVIDAYKNGFQERSWKIMQTQGSLSPICSATSVW